MAAARVDDPPQVALRIEAREFQFSPARIELEAGVPTRIELANRGAIDHAFVVRSSEKDRDLIHLHALAGSTDSGTFRIERPGRYAVACTIPGHTEAGMEAVLEVSGP